MKINKCFKKKERVELEQMPIGRKVECGFWQGEQATSGQWRAGHSDTGQQGLASEEIRQGRHLDNGTVSTHQKL